MGEFCAGKVGSRSTKDGSRLVGMKLFTCNRKMTLPGSWHNGTEVHLDHPESCNHRLGI